MHHLEGNAVSAGHTNAHYRRLTIYNSDAILPQTGKKIDQKCGPEFGGMLWRHPKYRCTTTILTCIKAPKMFWKIYFLYVFFCAQNCSFRAVFGLLIGTLTTALYSNVRKKIYIYVLGPKFYAAVFASNLRQQTALNSLSCLTPVRVSINSVLVFCISNKICDNI